MMKVMSNQALRVMPLLGLGQVSAQRAGESMESVWATHFHRITVPVRDNQSSQNMWSSMDQQGKKAFCLGLVETTSPRVYVFQKFQRAKKRIWPQSGM